MRTVNSTLTSALLSGHYKPYANIICWVDVGEQGNIYETHEALYFELTGTTAKVQYQKQTYESCYSFQIERGVKIGSTYYGLTTGSFYPRQVSNENDIITIEAHLFKQVKFISIAADDTYKNVITSFCIEIVKTPEFKSPTDEYWDYQFLPTGRLASFNNPAYFLGMLRQKYLMFACDNGDDDTVLFFYPAKSLSSASVDWTLTPEFFTYNAIIKKRNFIWRDEDWTLHYAASSGLASTYPVHNLGYVHSSHSIPRSSYPAGSTITSDLQDFEIICRPDLRYQDGDSIYIEEISLLSRILVKEIWKAGKAPHWQMIISAVQFFANTEGGNLPSSMDGIALYMPLNTSYFTNVLSAGDNNVQAGFETLDDHSHVCVSTDTPGIYVAGCPFHFHTTTGTLYVWNGIYYQEQGSAMVYDNILLENGDDFLLENGSTLYLG